jgi:hypothetical protein
VCNKVLMGCERRGQRKRGKARQSNARLVSRLPLVSTYEMVISSAIAIGRSATTRRRPSVSMHAAALGRQEWLCQPRRTESAQPAFSPRR